MRYFVGFLLTIGLIILLIILLFGGGKPKTPLANKPLSSYSDTSAQAILTIDGPINANSLHQQVRITVGNDNVTYEQIQGYDGNVVNMQNFANTENAYNVFLHALAHAGFKKGNTDKNLQDEKGYCPLGRRYIMELKQDNKDIERFWGTSCSGPKSYGGNLSLTVTLFQKQIPGYDELTRTLNNL
jgi:hypothetical protein